MKKTFLSISVLISLLLMISPFAIADLVVFDFEDQAATFIYPATRTGTLTTLTMTESGLTVTITREAEGQFDIVSNTGGYLCRGARRETSCVWVEKFGSLFPSNGGYCFHIEFFKPHNIFLR